MLISLRNTISYYTKLTKYNNIGKYNTNSIVRYINSEITNELIIDTTDNQINPITIDTTNQSPDKNINSLIKQLKKASKQYQSKPLDNETSTSQIDNNDIISGFNKLGLLNNIVNALSLQGYKEPTKVQSIVIPRVLNSESIVMAASTGSGKTLAFLIPLLQLLLIEEQNGYIRKANRPRAIILTPTRELAEQILDVIKSLSHIVKISSCSVLGGEKYEIQKKALSRMVDIVVASPGRLLQHKLQGNVYLSHVKHVIIDEVDTMFLQGFGPDIRGLLRAVLSVKPTPSTSSLYTYLSQPPQLVFVTATLTKSVKQLLQDLTGKTDEKSDAAVFDVDFADPTNKTPKKKLLVKTSDNETESFQTTINMKIVEVDGLHRSLPNVKYHFEDCSGNGGLKVVNSKSTDVKSNTAIPSMTTSGSTSLRDKVDVLIEFLLKPKYKSMKTLVFCNTVASCRAVLYKLEEHTPGCTTKELTTADPSIQSTDILNNNLSKKATNKPTNQLDQILSYHGSLNSIQRKEQLDIFRGIEKGKGGVMVCTDIAARGLDISNVEHVILFDFPLNPVDFLHRSGRCGRQDQSGLKGGLVTSFIMKRDIVLAQAILGAMSKGLPLDSLSSSKKDYQDRGKLATVVGRMSREESNKRLKQKNAVRNEIKFAERGTKTEKDKDRNKQYNSSNKSDVKYDSKTDSKIDSKTSSKQYQSSKLFSNRLNKSSNSKSNENPRKFFNQKRG